MPALRKIVITNKKGPGSVTIKIRAIDSRKTAQPKNISTPAIYDLTEHLPVEALMHKKYLPYA